MKRITSFTLALCLALMSQAQKNDFNHKMSLGFQLGQYQNDFGIGLNATSPLFFNNTTAIRLRGNLMWFEHLSTPGFIMVEKTWTPYSNLSFGIVGVAGEVGGFMRMYGEGGFVLLFPSNEFSEESSVFGGYGLFGFEFYSGNIFNYFIEIGGVGTGARANEILYRPIFSNGLIISVGARFHLGG